MTTTNGSTTRRQWLAGMAGLAGLTGLAGLSGCGGGGGGSGGDGGEPAPGAPAIRGLQADTATPWVGERVLLTAHFSGGSGRIEPDIGPVASGVPVATPVLAAPRRYTLVVGAPGRPSARRELALAVAYRDRYRVLPQGFAVQYHAAVPTDDGGALVIGGSRGLATSSEAIDRYDPLLGRFTRIGSLRSGRTQHSATRLGGGRTLVLGGQVVLQIGAIAELVDEASGEVQDAGRLVLPRTRHATVALADGRVLVVGGQARDSAELWDPATRRFRLLASRLRHVREFPSATLLADGRVLVFGGDHDPAVPHVAGEIFDPASERFTPLADAAADERRSMHQAFRLGDGTVLIAGGEVGEDTGIRPLASLLRFDPASGRLAPAGALDRPRTLACGVQGPGDELRLFGGQTADEEAAASASLWRPQGAPAARPLAALPEGRAWHSVTALGDGRLLVVGGADAAGGLVGSACLYE